MLGFLWHRDQGWLYVHMVPPRVSNQSTPWRSVQHCSSDTPPHACADDDDDMCHLLMPASRGAGSSRRGPQEVELTERMDDGGFDADGGDEQLRRRRGGEGNSGEAGSSLSPAPSDGGEIQGAEERAKAGEVWGGPFWRWCM